MKGRLWSYRWQIGLLPLFVASIWTAVGLNIAEQHAEFVAISVAYALGDILMVHSFVAETSRSRAMALGMSMPIFSGVFIYTFYAYHEAEYLFAQPLFWIAGWKSLTVELWPHQYPRFLNGRILGAWIQIIICVAVLMFFVTNAIPTVINLLQVIGVCLFGGMLAIGKDASVRTCSSWSLIGTAGLWIFTTACLGDVAYKYLTFGHVIATPLVAFFASLPVAIAALRDVFMRVRFA